MMAVPKFTMADAARSRIDEALEREAEPSAAFVQVTIADLADNRPPPPVYWWEGLLPAGVVTLLGAHGGSGKSWIALMLAASIAQGRELFGIATKRGRVAFFSAEDSAGLLRHRLAVICERLDIAPASLADRLLVLDATDGDPTLYAEAQTAGRRGAGVTTATHAELVEFVDQHEIDVLIVDNASDAFDASEIDRARVRGFMRALARIARRRSGAVLLLAHVNRSTAIGEQRGEGYSGSTAWHNSARSRLFLTRDKGGAMTLTHEKNNLGPTREPLAIDWPPDGVPCLSVPFGPVVQGIADRADLAALLRLIDEFTRRGESVSTATSGPATAAQLFKGDPAFPPRLRRELPRLIRRADRDGLIERESYRNASRKERERWVLTAAGRGRIGAPAPVAPVAPVAAIGATAEPARAPAPVAPVPAHRGVGGQERAQTGAPDPGEVPAP